MISFKNKHPCSLILQCLNVKLTSYFTVVSKALTICQGSSFFYKIFDLFMHRP